MTGARPALADLVASRDPPGGAALGPGQSGVARAADRDSTVCGDFGIRIARDGTWFYHGSPIGRKPLCRLFATVLQRDEAGDYWLVTPAERGRIVVDDAPFTAVTLGVEGAGRTQRLTFRTNLDDEVVAGADHPIRVADRPAPETGIIEPSPFVLVRDRLEARIVRPVFYQLVDLAGEETDRGRPRLGVWSGGEFFPLDSGS